MLFEHVITPAYAQGAPAGLFGGGDYTSFLMMIAIFAASFMLFPATELVEPLNWVVGSSPRPVHRPDSTQNDAIGTLPDFGATMKSVAIVRSCCPPRTMSPDWT